MLRKKNQFAGALWAAFIAAVVPCSASQISFDALAGNPNYSAIPANYGSTAQVTVTYETENPVNEALVPNANCGVQPSCILFWNSGSYGDLPYAAFANANGNYAEIILTPIPGYSITLQSFQLAGWPNADQPNQTILVENGSGATLVDFSGTVTGTGHNTYTPNITVNGPVQIEFGPSWNTGINYINFTAQPMTGVPEPGTYALLSIGLGAVGLRLRRRR